MSRPGVCTLCKEQRPLIRKSHIVPDFMYQGIWDNLHRMYFLNFESGTSQIRQTGIFEKYILCKKCDGERLSFLESYGSSVFNGGSFSTKVRPSGSKERKEDGFDLITMDNLDYSLFSLFLISIIWRIHLSTHVGFKDIEILEENAETIREHILHRKAFKTTFCKISVIGLLKKNGSLTSYHSPCFHINEHEEDNLFIVINGFVYFFNFRPTTTKFAIPDEFYLEESGRIRIPVLHYPHSKSFAAAISPVFANEAFF